MLTIALLKPLNISETVEAWFQRTTNRKLPTGNPVVTWPWRHVTREVKLVTQYA